MTPRLEKSFDGRIATYLAPLATRRFRLLWLGQTVSSAGDGLILVGFVFAVLYVGGSVSDIGYIAAAQTVSRVVFTLAGGVWADRLKRQYVMLAADAVRAVVQASLAYLLLSGHARVLELGIGASIFGAAKAFFGPASAGLLPETLEPEQLQPGNALMSISDSFFEVGGPAVAGLLIAVVGPGLLFAIDSLSFVVSAFSLGLLDIPPRNFPQRESFFTDLGVGWHELVIRRWYWLNLCAHAIWNFAFPCYLVLGPVIALHRLGGAAAWGLISAAWAIGAIIGGLLALRLKPSRPLIICNLTLLMTTLPVLALVPPLAAWVVAIAAAFSGGGLIFMSSLWISTVQQLIPSEVRSRVDSYDWLISLTFMPAGYILVGPLASRIGDDATLIGAALLQSVPLVLVAIIPETRAVRRSRKGELIAPGSRGFGEVVTSLSEGR